MRLFRSICWIATLYMRIFLIWTVLELIIYGEIQNRVVDDIITVIWIVSLFMFFGKGFMAGFEYGVKAAYIPPQLCNNKESVKKEER